MEPERLVDNAVTHYWNGKVTGGGPIPGTHYMNMNIDYGETACGESLDGMEFDGYSDRLDSVTCKKCLESKTLGLYMLDGLQV